MQQRPESGAEEDLALSADHTEDDGNLGAVAWFLSEAIAIVVILGVAGSLAAFFLMLHRNPVIAPEVIYLSLGLLLVLYLLCKRLLDFSLYRLHNLMRRGLGIFLADLLNDWERQHEQD